MRSTSKIARKEFDLHSEVLTGRSLLAEKYKSIEFLAGVAERDELPDRLDSLLLDVLIATINNKNRPADVRLNALKVISKLLACPMFSHTETLVDKGIIDVLAVAVDGKSDEVRAMSTLAARHIANCCPDCRKELCEAGVTSAILRQLHTGGYDASIEAARDFLMALIAKNDAVIDPTELVPALALAIRRFGADNDEIGEIATVLLLWTAGAAALVWQHQLLVDWLLNIIAADNECRASSALRFVNLLLEAGDDAQKRWFIAQGHFFLHLVQWMEWEDSCVAWTAASALKRIAAGATANYADVVLTSPALITQLVRVSAAPRREWTDAIIVLVSVLQEVTVGGPTTQSEFLLGYGFLPRFVRSVVSRYNRTHEAVRCMVAALPIIVRAHPQLSRQLYEAGATRLPLQLAIPLRPQRPQLYVIEDEDLESI